MKLKNEFVAIQEIRKRQLEWGFRAAAVMGIFALIASLLRAYYVGWQNIMYLHIIIYLVILMAAILNTQGSFFIRASIILGITYILGLAGLISWGLTGQGIVALFTFCIVTTMLFGVRAGVISACISIISLIIIGTAIIRGMIVTKFDPLIYINSSIYLGMAVTALTFAAGLIVVALGTMNRQVNDMVEALKTRNKNLYDTNRQLEKEFNEHKRLEKEKAILEAKLQHARKMEAIGTLAGGVAHDLNNVLSGIVSYPDLLLMQISPDDPLRKPMETIRKSGEKAAAIVNDLLTLARGGVKTVKVINLNEIVTEYIESSWFAKVKEHHPGIELVVHLEKELLNIKGSSAHLMKCLMNLVSNAAEAMPGGGKLSIVTKNNDVHRDNEICDKIEPGNYVTLKVSDSGKGISMEDKERIFEPFYTKKNMGRSGTGLGMSVVWSTVTDLYGHIELESNGGEGTTFTLYFPSTPLPLEPIKSPSEAEQYGNNGESILVVDDMAEQRELLFELLTKYGFSVTTASSGEKAVEHLEQSTVDLVILDMIMDPGMDGLSTYEKIIHLHPGQKAIIVSGFSETDQIREAKKLGIRNFIKKPYLSEDIISAVTSELNRKLNAPQP